MSDSEERFKNLLLYKMYVTDEELEQVAPMLVGFLFIVLLIVWLIYWLVK